MHDALSAFPETSGYLLPEDTYARLHDVVDELQMLAELTATGHLIDGELQMMEFKRAGLARYLRGVYERIENALQECRYPAEIIDAEDGE